MVIGSMGSGTTLLRLMLDSHPNIMIAQETGFLRAAQAQYFIPFWKFGGEWLSRIGMEEPELRPRSHLIEDCAPLQTGVRVPTLVGLYVTPQPN